MQQNIQDAFAFGLGIFLALALVAGAIALALFVGLLLVDKAKDLYVDHMIRKALAAEKRQREERRQAQLKKAADLAAAGVSEAKHIVINHAVAGAPRGAHRG